VIRAAKEMTMVRWLLVCPGWFVASLATAQALLDPTFGSGGRTTVFFDQTGTSLSDHGVRILRAPNDKYYVFGDVDIADPNPQVMGIGMARLLPDGGLDAPFGGANTGQRIKNAGLNYITDATLDYYNPLVVGPYSGDSALVRFQETGADDAGFAGDGGFVWDASGIGEWDAPGAVSVVESNFFVAGTFDAAAGALVDYDIYAGVVNDAGTAIDIFLREELGGTDGDGDYVVDMVEGDGGDFDTAASLVILADNQSPDYAGTVMVFDGESQARLYTIRLEGIFMPSATGCDSDFVDAQSTDVVRMDDRRVAVVGNLMANVTTPGQPYVVIVDVVDGSVDGVACAPANSGIFVVAGKFLEYDDFLTELHLAVTVSGKAGYWRWARNRAEPGIVYRPDPLIQSGQPVTVDFASASGSAPLGRASSVEVDDQGRPVVLGSRLYQTGPGVFDQDFAIFRLHASERIFTNGFDPPAF
jgi:hypothetical protein